MKITLPISSCLAGGNLNLWIHDKRLLGAKTYPDGLEMVVECDGTQRILTDEVNNIIENDGTFTGLESYLVLPIWILNKKVPSTFPNSQKYNNEGEIIGQKTYLEWSQSDEPVYNEDQTECYIFAFSTDAMSDEKEWKACYDFINRPKEDDEEAETIRLKIKLLTRCELNSYLKGGE